MCGVDAVLALRKQKLDQNSSFVIPDAGRSGSYDKDDRRRSLTAFRGPDSNKSLLVERECFALDMFSSVLHIQGDAICEQPCQSTASGSAFAWNGEFLNHPASSRSDTQLILDLLESGESPVCVLDKVEGPFSFLYYDERDECVWFGKDKQGRRSLLVSVFGGFEVCVSSCGLVGGVEVPAGYGIFRLGLVSGELSFREWSRPIPYLSPTYLATGSGEIDVHVLHGALQKGIQRHMTNTTRVGEGLGILFSGGLDSSIIAFIAASLFFTASHSLTSIDLINVASTPTAPDRLTGLASFAELLRRFPLVPFRFILVEAAEGFSERILTLIAPNSSHMDFNIGSALWFGARAEGRLVDPLFCESKDWEDMERRILISESLEAAVGDRTSKFEKKKSAAPCAVCGCRKAKAGCVACKFCCVGCSVHRKPGGVVPGMIDEATPCISEFLTPFLSPLIKSDCRILLVGHGADELFAGYGRHARSVREEMLLDLSRLWSRNLGRDDRVVADHARDARHPFLDEAVVELVGRHAPPLTSNKAVLRRLASECLGLKLAPKFRKRAIQFGTRLAQQTNISCFGSHSKGSGTARYMGPIVSSE